MDPAFPSLGLALLLGLLVGMQRQRTQPRLAGVRTFALITLLGAVCGFLARELDGGVWVIAAGFLAVTASLAMGNILSTRSDNKPDPGITTEIAAIVMYGVGVLFGLEHWAVAAAVGGAVAILLQLKAPLHRTVAKLGEGDVTAIMQFALVSVVILPVVPNQTFGPMGVLNPRQIWLMVVLVVGMSLIGYVGAKFIPARAGTLLHGIAGGLISSTAATVSASRRAHSGASHVPSAALIITLATTVLYARLIVAVALVAPSHMRAIIPPLAALLLLMAMISAVLWFTSHKNHERPPEAKNPSELKPALIFAGLYALILLAAAYAQQKFGQAGMYAVATMSGLTDMDAITLSSARLSEQGQLTPANAWRAILVASLSNLVFKFGIAAWLGGAALAKKIGMVFGIVAGVTIAVLLIWPH